MVEVIEAKPVPRRRITCTNCNSILEYGNADLHESITSYMSHPYTTAFQYADIKDYTIKCPNCGVEVKANWIYEKKEPDNNI